jgi:hypothetical protein
MRLLLALILNFVLFCIQYVKAIIQYPGRYNISALNEYNRRTEDYTQYARNSVEIIISMRRTKLIL